MGRDGWPLYCEMDLGSAIEETEKLVAKIKSNKFDGEDLEKLAELSKVIAEKANKDED